MNTITDPGVNKYHFWSLIIKYANGFLELLLAIRVVFKLFNANSKAPIVDAIYKISDFFLAPFKSIFSNIYFNSGIIDVVAVSAMIGYLILTLIVLKFLQLIFLRTLAK